MSACWGDSPVNQQERLFFLSKFTPFIFDILVGIYIFIIDFERSKKSLICPLILMKMSRPPLPPLPLPPPPPPHPPPPPPKVEEEV